MNKMKRTMPLVLALASLLLAACQPTSAPQDTAEAEQIAETVESSTAAPLPTHTAVPEIATDSPSPEASPWPTVTPKATPTTEALQTPDVGGGVAYEIRRLAEVSTDGPPQIVDITDVDAVLIFESSSPLACSVVYGKSTEYGQISVDQDMDGGAHTDHHPLLLGLEPDTEYHYRVQGTAADGTLYVGDDGTFRTLPAEQEAEVNLASLEAGARVVAVSSSFGGAANDQAWGGSSALDGNRGTAWSSDGDGNEAFIEIELAQPAKLSAVEVWTRTMSDGSAQILAFTLTSDRGEIWGPFTLEDASKAYRFDVDGVARSLRLDVVESSGGNTGLIELAVYGMPIED